MLVVCPNCKEEFIVGDEVTGECPSCKIKLIFRGEGEIIEKVNIKEIEKKVDEITEGEIKASFLDKILIDNLPIKKDLSELEEKIDELID
ncbi:MAG: hypothetical protein DRN29_00785 [Thermoplasmata archaeon]|nr:MAG: hypothetical protein DRN29_00785 [Thermoplasmata archaeon]